MVKVYNKAGRPNYKEMKLIPALTDAIEKKMAADPLFRFTPASNFDELQQYYNRYCIDPTPYEEVKRTEPTGKTESVFESNQTKTPPPTDTLEDGELDTNANIDPLNREEPIVRDYVLSNDLPTDAEKKNGQKQTKTSFDEPQTHEQAFEMPNYDDDEDDIKPKKGGEKDKKSPQEPKSGINPTDPINPEFNTLDKAKKKKKTRELASYIVKAGSALTKMGFIWYTTRNITDAKLLEMEVSGDIDLSILVTLDQNTQATIKEFFIQQRVLAEKESEIDAETQEDLTECLTEILMQKGVALTPEQEIYFILVTRVLLPKTLTGYQIVAQQKSIITQLKELKQSQISGNQEPQQPVQSSVEPPKQQRQPVQEPIKERVVENEYFDNGSLEKSPIEQVEDAINSGNGLHTLE